MDSIICPYCSVGIPDSDVTKQILYPSFERASSFHQKGRDIFCDNSSIAITFYKCPTCDKYVINAVGIGESVKDVNVQILPTSLATQFPDYIPLAIRQDYEEAYAIVNLSPKASATLSRRCLQGMIRDFWGISKSSLYEEIGELKDKIPATQWKVIEGIRRIGNIGAHMEKDINLIIDIEPLEAQKLLKLIEHLLKQWYINRHEQEQLYNDIIAIDNTKQSERKRN